MEEMVRDGIAIGPSITEPGQFNGGRPNQLYPTTQGLVLGVDAFFRHALLQ
jgi:hypothetical protein